MNFSDRPPSQEWTTLKYKREPLAEVWFKPETEPFALTFRITQTSFQIPGMRQQLTAESLLKAVGITPQEVESWRHEGAVDASMNKSNAELSQSLPPPLHDIPYLHLYVRLQPPSQAVACNESADPVISEARWQELEARWNKIQGLEASMDTMRISLDALRTEMEASVRKALTGDDKIYAASADVVQWTKAKSRVHFALPKVKEFIHRATWALGAPERKQLQELFKDHLPPRLPVAQINQLAEQLESLFKNRQVLNAHGVSVYQESKTIAAEVQAALKTLQSNAAAKATKKRAANARGRFR